MSFKTWEGGEGMVILGDRVIGSGDKLSEHRNLDRHSSFWTGC